MLKANLSENAFQKQMKAGAVNRNDILKHSKAYFFPFSYLLGQNLLPFT